MNINNEKETLKINGFLALFLFITVFIILLGLSLIAYQTSPLLMIPLVFIKFLMIISLGGFCIIRPNEAMVLTFFGKYIGTIKDNGYWFKNPFSIGQRVSLKVRNFESPILKVNDLNGNPIEIACVVSWKIYDSVKAVFDVEDYNNFVQTQSETSIRFLATHYPYDSEVHETSLRGSTDQVCETLEKELSKSLKSAGIQVIDAKLTHLAYSPEIAQAMLRKQQAQAIISARKTIVEGAVSMVEMALLRLSEKNIVELDNDKKAIMVNNLLVTLVSENETKPVINTGTIY
ncbi:MAG: SPFH domain-containing protein [Cyanobacteriota bacterium]